MYIWLILHHRLFLSWQPKKDTELSCGYLKHSGMHGCGFPFVEDLLYGENIRSAKFRYESGPAQHLNNLPKMNVQAFIVD